MGGHGHDGPGAVAREDVVGDPNGDLAAGHRVQGKGAGPDAGFVFGQLGAFQIGLGSGELLILLHRRGLCRRGNSRHEPMLGRQHHVGCPEQGVGPRGEHPDLLRLAIHLEINLGALAAADPVALHLLERVRPLNGVQVGQELFGIGGDAQHPLAHRLANHREAAHLALAVDDLFVGQHGAQLGAPIHRRLGDIGQALGIAEGALLSLGLAVGWVGQRLDRLGLVGGGVEPRVVDLQEDPLRPPKVFRIGGGQLARPVVAEAQRLDLARKIRDVGLGGDPRVLARLHGVLLRRQAERVPTHRVQHVEALGPAIARQDVRRRVPLGMPDMQAGPGGVGEHVEDVELRRQFRRRRSSPVQPMAQPEGVGFRNAVPRVPRPESLFRRPVPLPPGFNQMKRVLPPRHIRPLAWRDPPPLSNPVVQKGSVPHIYTKGVSQS